MAMNKVEVPSREFVQGAFERAAQAGDKIFLTFCETFSDPYSVTSRYSYEAVRDEGDIPILLELMEARAAHGGNSVSLVDVMDLTRAFNDQPNSADRMETILSAETRAELEARKAAKALELQKQQWAQLRFYQRWFTPFPGGDRKLG